MALTSAQLTGLVLGILLPVLLIALATFLIHRYRRNSARSSPKAFADDGTSEPTSENLNSSPRFSLALDDEADALRRGTVRRQTGQPQTFTDWVRASNLDEEGARGKGGVMGRDRWPSLEYGPGPIIFAHSQSAPATPSATAAVSVAVDGKGNAGKNEGVQYSADGNEGVEQATCKGSIDESSLRDAVLGIDARNDEVQRQESEETKNYGDAKEVKAEAKEEGQVRKTRGYSGAWP